MSNLIFKNEECKVATFRDVTELKKLAKIEADNKLLQLLTSSVTHEMVTPLKCIVNFSESLVKELRNSPKKHEAELIMTTSKLLLAQTKLLLDKNMLEHDLFTPIFEISPFNKTISDAVSILEK